MALIRALRHLGVAVTLVGCAGSSVRTAPPGSPAGGDVVGVIDRSQLPWTEADVRFMSGMIGHHAQAIVMAEWAPSHGASAELQVLAGRIINAQKDEIARMQRWLRDRKQPVPVPDPRGMKHVVDGVEHHMLMPGMLSDDKLKQLDAARGLEFDRLFLTFMIEHHKGAVTMVQELIDTDGAAQDDTVFKLAADINVDQTTEIARMERMLFLRTLERGRSP